MGMNTTMVGINIGHIKSALTEVQMKVAEFVENSHAKLKRGMVWCRTCGKSQKVDSSNCIRDGWPKCCGYTMTIDSPEERAAPEEEI